MEFKRPDFTNVKTAYVRADSNGVIQDLNNVYMWAEMTAKAKGHAIWETSTKTLIYPKNVEVKPPAALVQTGESDFLNELKDMIEKRLGEI